MARTPPKSSKSAVDDTVALPRSIVNGIVSVDPSAGKGEGTPLQDTLSSYLNRDVAAAIRSEATVNGAIRALQHASGDVSTAVASAVHLANTPLSLTAYDSAHQIAPDGAMLVNSILNRFENLVDYTYGFDDRQALTSVTETLLQEVLLSGASGLELVLDKARLPFALKPVSPTQLKWKVSNTATGKHTNKIIPWLQLAGSTVELDIPTFFYAALQKDPTVVYPRSPLETAIPAALFQQDVIQDIRRVVRRSGHSRLSVSLNLEGVLNLLPLDVRADPKKLEEALEQYRAAVQNTLADLNPESALVFYDTVEATYLNSEIGAKSDYTPLVDISDGVTSTALRTPAAVLGKRMSAGSQNVASTEGLLFIQTAASVQVPVQVVLSRALTLAVRLVGFDGYVKAKFAPVNLRPEEELEAFKQMRQARVLELLSLGFLTDQEAAERLGTGMRAAGAPALSGTMFYQGKAQTEPPSPNADPAKRALTGNAPRSSGGKDNTAR